MSTATIVMEGEGRRLPRPLTGADSAVRRLAECARTLRQHVKKLHPQGDSKAPAAAWLIGNHSYLQAQIRETQRSLPARYVRMLPKEGEGASAELRVFKIATALLLEAEEVIDAAAVEKAAADLKEHQNLSLVELWAFDAALKLVLIEHLCANLDSERVVSLMVKGLRALEQIAWRDFVESVSVVERALERDPAEVYARMDFTTRDQYRHQVEKMARRSKLSELEVAEKAVEFAAKQTSDAGKHVGYWLVGDGAPEFRRSIGCKGWFGIRTVLEQSPNAFYFSSIALMTALIVAAFAWVTGPFAWWIALLLLIPASQAGIEIVNALVSRLLKPHVLPSMDFSDGIPDDCKTMVVVPTLVYSEANVARLLEDLEIRYLANREANLSFALLTDFGDADREQTPNDSILKNCAEGIQRLNERYAFNGPGPFYLFHRSRKWNQAESKWMGYERKRGKLNDFNRLLLGRGNCFETVIGEQSLLRQIRYVITLDTDTQLPRDTATKMVGAAAHPLNRPMVDAATGMVKSGYALLRPRVAVSMESCNRSRLAQIFSGKAGFDPYATAVSDVYQDLFNSASFTGKGIYDVEAFEAAVGDRFPENAILSHDLIEGEYARTGLLTSVELVEDSPTTYEAFTKRKHRWVRGDWQLLPWLGMRTPVARGERERNPLPFLSRWKMFDNLRRSLLEISILLLFVAGWLMAEDATRWTIAVLALLALPVYADLLLTVGNAPERRLLPAFLRNVGERMFESHRDVFLTLVFIPHQALMMLDAIGRTLVRRFITQRNLLQWETMAQSEAAKASGITVPTRYLYLACGISLLLLGFVNSSLLVALVCSAWITAPFVAGWLNEAPVDMHALSANDREFLRGTALRTWRFFADHSKAEENWLVPDNVQQDPPLTAHHISPTNLGLLATTHLAALDFGYSTIEEFRGSLRRVLNTAEKLERYRGHLFNWYDTRTLEPMNPRFVSTVDSGNLAASLCTLRQGVLGLLKQPVVGAHTLRGLRDQVLRLREELPYAYRSGSLMRPVASLLRQLEHPATDLFFLEAVLTDARDIWRRMQEPLTAMHRRLEKQGEHDRSAELRYWELLVSERLDAALSELYRLTPWLVPEIEPELRLNLRDESLAPLLAELCVVPTLEALPELYEKIRAVILDRLGDEKPLYPSLRQTLEALLMRLPRSRVRVVELIEELKGLAERSGRMFEEMDFAFLFDSKRKLLRIGYDAAAGQHAESYYDLLASEARTAVFLAIAKGDIPRDAWFRLGRKLTAYRNRRTLLSWTGTMFEYLMPLLHMRSYENTLLDSGARGAVQIQQLYSRERGVPWGISEAAYAARDERMQYQYRAFGVPSMSASSEKSERLVIAPYASMLALMVDPGQATANLRGLAAKGCLSRYGFCESLEYSSGNHHPELIHCFMAHHQGMGLLAMDNALLGEKMQQRFHVDPMVQATEFLLQERMPAMVEVLSESGDVAA
ncbi:MAG TPA: glucoamylase family protein [Bryobacteraceae bacterium]|nr:glucoamylase family protein [Bryobacteraceae bacterium]